MSIGYVYKALVSLDKRRPVDKKFPEDKGNSLSGSKNAKSNNFLARRNYSGKGSDSKKNKHFNTVYANEPNQKVEENKLTGWG